MIEFFNQPVVWLYSFELWKILLFTLVTLVFLITVIIIIVKSVRKSNEIKFSTPVKSVNVVVRDKSSQQDKTYQDKSVNQQKLEAEAKEEEIKEEDIYIKQPEKKIDVKNKDKDNNSNLKKIDSKEELDFDIEEFEQGGKTEDKKDENVTLNKEESKLQEIQNDIPAAEPKMYEAVLNNISKTDDVKNMVDLADVKEEDKEIDIDENVGNITNTKEPNSLYEDVNKTEVEDNEPISDDISKTDFNDVKMPSETRNDNEFDIEELNNDKDSKTEEFNDTKIEEFNKSDEIKSEEISASEIKSNEINNADEFDISEFDIDIKSVKSDDSFSQDLKEENVNNQEIDNKIDANELSVNEDIKEEVKEIKEKEKIPEKEEKILKGAKAKPNIKVIPKKPINKKEIAATVTTEIVKEETPKTVKKIIAPKSIIKPVPAAAKIKETAKTAAAPKKETTRTGSSGKFEIIKIDDKYKYTLLANNGQLLYESLSYTSLANCKNAITTFKKNVVSGEFSIEKDKSGTFKYILKKGNTIYYGETYNTEKSAKSGIESVKKYSETALIIIND